MEKKLVKKILKGLQSLKFRVFIIVAVSIIVPVILLSIFITAIGINIHPRIVPITKRLIKMVIPVPIKILLT